MKPGNFLYFSGQRLNWIIAKYVPNEKIKLDKNGDVGKCIGVKKR